MNRWQRRTPRRPRRRTEKPDRGRPGLRERIPRWIEVTAAAVVVAGAAFAALAFLVNQTENLIERGDSADVEVRQVVVANGPLDARLIDGALRQTRKSTPQLDITVRNTGDKPVLLTRARIEIEDSARLTICEFQTGGEIPLAGDYAIELPTVPISGERVLVHPLHQEVPAGGVDRFKLFFRTPRLGEDAHIYALRVTLATDAPGGTVKVGNFVLSIPESIVIGRTGRILPIAPSFEGELDPRYRLQSTWCLRRNLAELQRVLARKGKRSRSVGAFADVQLAKSWPDFIDDRPAAAAVEPLLRSPNGPGPLFAVFAAERTGNSELVKKTRSRAAVAMIHNAEHGLELGYGFAIQAAIEDLHYALIFAPSAEARELLKTAEARLPAAEAQELAVINGD